MGKGIPLALLMLSIGGTVFAQASKTGPSARLGLPTQEIPVPGPAEIPRENTKTFAVPSPPPPLLPSNLKRLPTTVQRPAEIPPDKTKKIDMPSPPPPLLPSDLKQLALPTQEISVQRPPEIRPENIKQFELPSAPPPLLPSNLKQLALPTQKPSVPRLPEVPAEKLQRLDVALAPPPPLPSPVNQSNLKQVGFVPEKLPDYISAGPVGKPRTSVEVPPAAGLIGSEDAPLGPLVMREKRSPDSSPNVWGRAEAVSWWLQGGHLPPLVTTSPVGTPLAQAGVLGTPGTSTVFGDQRVNGDLRPGTRFTFGAWLNEERTWGLEAGVMLIGGRDVDFTASSNGSQILTRPFVDATSGAEVAELVSFPGIVKGSVEATASSDPLVIADVALATNLCADCGRRFDLLMGYRTMHFSESLQIQENLTSLDPFTLGTNLLVSDSFATSNIFNGGLLGFRTELTSGLCSLQLFTKMAIGNMQRTVRRCRHHHDHPAGCNSNCPSRGPVGVAEQQRDLHVQPIYVHAGVRTNSRLQPGQAFAPVARLLVPMAG